MTVRFIRSWVCGAAGLTLVACGPSNNATSMGPAFVSTPPAGGAGAGGTRSATAGATAGNAGGSTPSVVTPPSTSGGGGSVAPQVGGAGGADSVAIGGAGGGGAAPIATATCKARTVSMGDAQLHFHHVHFNSPDPSKDIEFIVKFYNGKAVDFCMDEKTGAPTPAIQTERGYFLFTHVAEAPNGELNSELDHVGYAHPMPNAELKRLMMLQVPLWPDEDGNNITGQCKDVAMGTACFSGTFFYTKMPNGARLEVSNSPGPSTMGFGHAHLKGPIPDFFMKVLGPALKPMAGNNAANVDGVNITNTLLDRFEPMPPSDTKGKPIDHLAYSTTDLMATYMRIKDAGIMIQEEISMKPEYGFKSFFVKSPQGIWIEIVEDSPFQAKP